MRLIGYRTTKTPAPSINLVPKTRQQILLDGQLAGLVRQLSRALGYASMSGLINDALVSFIEHNHHDKIKMEFDKESAVAASANLAESLVVLKSV